MGIVEWVQVATLIVVSYYTYETSKLRQSSEATLKVLRGQLEAKKEAFDLEKSHFEAEQEARVEQFNPILKLAYAPDYNRDHRILTYTFENVGETIAKLEITTLEGETRRLSLTAKDFVGPKDSFQIHIHDVPEKNREPFGFELIFTDRKERRRSLRYLFDGFLKRI